MKELNQGSVVSILVHGVVLGAFAWLTWDADFSAAAGGDEAPAGADISAVLAASGPVDLSNIRVAQPQQPVPPQPEEPAQPEMPPEIHEQPAPPAAQPDPEPVPDGVPVLPPKQLQPKPPKKQPETAKTPAKNTPPTTAVTPHQETQAEKIARIRSGLKKTPGRPVKLAALPSFSGGGGPSTDAGAIAGRIGSGVSNNTINVSSGGSGGGSGAGGSGGDNGFAGAMQRFLRENWRTDGLSISGGKPVVRVAMTLAPDGTVTSASIVRESGVAALNANVSAFLRTLRKVPAPSRYGISTTKTYTVNFIPENGE